MLDLERQRTAQLNERLIETEETNRVLQTIVEKLKESTEIESRQKMEEYITQLEQKIQDQEVKMVELEQGIRQLSTQRQELRQELRQEREAQNCQMMEAIEAECQRYNREIDELANMYENNEKILKNNIRITEQNLNQKLESAVMDKERLNEVIHQMKQEADDFKKQLDYAQSLHHEQQMEIHRLSKIVTHQTERFKKEESQLQEQLTKKHQELDHLRTRLSRIFEEQQSEEQKKQFINHLPDRFDIESDLMENMRKEYEEVLLENSKLKERIRELELVEQAEGKALTKVKSTESLNIFKQLENGNWAENAFKYRGSGSASEKSQDDEVERLRQEVSSLQEEVYNAQQKNEKLLAKYNEAVHETGHMTKLYLTEQESRVLLMRKKTQQTNNLNKQIEKLNRTVQTLTSEKEQLKSKLSYHQNNTKIKEEETSLFNRKVSKSKIKSIDASFNETALSPREKEIIRLRRQIDQMTHELQQIKTATSRSKEQLHRQLEKCIRKAVDMKMEHEDLREDYELLRTEYNDMRKSVRK